MRSAALEKGTADVDDPQRPAALLTTVEIDVAVARAGGRCVVGRHVVVARCQARHGFDRHCVGGLAGNCDSGEQRSGQQSRPASRVNDAMTSFLGKNDNRSFHRIGSQGGGWAGGTNKSIERSGSRLVGIRYCPTNLTSQPTHRKRPAVTPIVGQSIGDYTKRPWGTSFLNRVSPLARFGLGTENSFFCGAQSRTKAPPNWQPCIIPRIRLTFRDAGAAWTLVVASHIVDQSYAVRIAR